MNDYYIKRGYKARTESCTLDHKRKSKYWDKQRIYASAFYQADVYKIAKKLIEKYKFKTIVDIGCGYGVKLNNIIYRSFPNARIIGIDQKSAIDYCKNNYKFGEFYEDDFENPSKKIVISNIDLIICADVIEHVLNPDILLNYITSMADNNTLIIFSTPERDLARGKGCMTSPQTKKRLHMRYVQVILCKLKYKK